MKMCIPRQIAFDEKAYWIVARSQNEHRFGHAEFSAVVCRIIQDWDELQKAERLRSRQNGVREKNGSGNGGWGNRSHPSGELTDEVYYTAENQDGDPSGLQPPGTGAQPPDVR